MVAVMYGCFFKSNVKLKVYAMLQINELLAVSPCQHTAAEHEAKEHPDSESHYLRAAAMLDGNGGSLYDGKGWCAFL